MHWLQIRNHGETIWINGLGIGIASGLSRSPGKNWVIWISQKANTFHRLEFSVNFLPRMGTSFILNLSGAMRWIGIISEQMRSEDEDHDWKANSTLCLQSVRWLDSSGEGNFTLLPVYLTTISAMNSSDGGRTFVAVGLFDSTSTLLRVRSYYAVKTFLLLWLN